MIRYCPSNPTLETRIFEEKDALWTIALICIRFSNKSAFRNYVCEVLKKVLHEIKNHRTFDSLQKEVDNIAKKLEGERNLEESAQMWLSQAKQLREQLESDKKANEEDRKRTIKLAQESDARVDHAIFINSGKLGNK